ncbi:unnamed protein product [Colias eurytheme]|nr:unnamed protein product [Colias eurytheme]
MSSARQNELSDLKSYIKNIDKEITLILQSLQWNRGTLISEKPPVTCALNMAHKVPLENKAKHEEQCWLKSLGYYAQDKLLPEPLDPNANTIVKLGPNDIKLIIDTASNNDPSFKKGNGWNEPVPLTLERVQTTYTMDERRAIHDAVVASVPACHDLSDLALFDVNAVKSESEDVKRSRTEILAELRDMKRRRTKYRVAAKSRNYSDVLRDVIKTQMEMFTDTQTECGHTSDANISSESTRRDDDYSNIQMHIKRERSTSRQRDYSESRNGNERNNNSDQRYDSRDSRSSNRHHKRKRSRSKDIYEYRDKRHTSSNDRGREKRDRKEKDHYRKERSSRQDYDDRGNKESTSRRDDDDRTNRDKHEERRENRRYSESHRDEHTKRSYHSDNKYEGRRKDKHSRNYDERVRDERHESDKYNRDNQRTDNYYTKERRHDRSKHSKRDTNLREYSEDNRYWNNDAVKIKQEVDESPHDRHEHTQSGNGFEDRSPQKVTIKQEKDDYEYE